MDWESKDVITILKRERTHISLLDPDSAGYDEAVRRLDELERSSSGYAPDAREDLGLRRVIAFRVGADPDERSIAEPSRAARHRR
jgi:hypothetical protein